MSDDDKVQAFRVQSSGWDDLPAPELGPMSEPSPAMILSELAAQNKNVEFTPYGDGTVSVAVDNCIVADGHPSSPEVWEVLAREAGY